MPDNDDDSIKTVSTVIPKEEIEASQKRLESLPVDHEVAQLGRHLNLIGPASSDSIDGESIMTGISLTDRTISPTHQLGRVKLAPTFTPPSADKKQPAADLANVLIGRTIGSIVQKPADDSEELYEEEEPQILVGKNLSEILCRMVDKHGLVCDGSSKIVDINVPAMQGVIADVKKNEKLKENPDETLTPKTDPREHPDMNPDGTIGKIIYGDWRVTHPERWRAHCAKIDAEEAAKAAKAAQLTAGKNDKPSSSCRPADQPANPDRQAVPNAVHPPAAVDYTLQEVTLIDPVDLDPAPYMKAVQDANEIVWALDPQFTPQWDQSAGVFHQSGKFSFSIFKLF